MALSPTTCASNISSGYDDLLAGLPVDFASVFETAYDDYASAGIVLGATNTGGTSSLIYNFIASVQSRPETIDEFATALAGYWATVAIAAGTPAHGGISVVSVTNDALLHVAEFKAAITASITSSDSPPYFEDLISNIESIGVASVIWTVTEMMAGTPPFPVAYPETIA